MNQMKSCSGFTLIEILVASVILFSSIAAVTLIYKGAYLSSDKAASHMLISGMASTIATNIRQNIRQRGNESETELKNEGTSLGVKYHWKANLLEFRAPPNIYDIDSGKVTVPENKYKLWQVELTLKHGSAEKTYYFKELSWNDK